MRIWRHLKKEAGVIENTMNDSVDVCAELNEVHFMDVEEMRTQEMREGRRNGRRRDRDGSREDSRESTAPSSRAPSPPRYTDMPEAD